MGLFSPHKKSTSGVIHIVSPGAGSSLEAVPFHPKYCAAYTIHPGPIPSCRPPTRTKVTALPVKQRGDWYIKVSWENMEPGYIEWVAKNHDVPSPTLR